MPTMKGLIVKNGKVTDGAGTPITPFTAAEPEPAPKTSKKEAVPDETWTNEELYNYGKEHDIYVTKMMNKKELLRAIK